MCILQPCALPTGVGVWWRDDSNFVQYGEAHSYIIKEGLRNKLRSVDLGTITSKVHPKGARYTADLTKMEQVAVSSGQKRDIVIVEPPGLLGSKLGPAPMLDNKPANQGPSFTPKLHFRDSSGQLRQYEAGLTAALLNCIAGGQQRKMVLQDSSCGKYLLFDFEEMKQFVVSHFNGENGGEPVADKTPPVEVILEIPWNPVAMVAIAKTADNYGRRALLVMFVDRFRSEQHLDVALSNKALPRNVLAKKIDSSLTVGHPAYERFLDSLDTVATTIPMG